MGPFDDLTPAQRAKVRDVQAVQDVQAQQRLVSGGQARAYCEALGLTEYIELRPDGDGGVERTVVLVAGKREIARQILGGDGS